MATVLAFDTSQNWCTVVLSKDNHIIHQHTQHLPRGHSEILMPKIIHGLDEANITMAELDTIASLRGPGSFTGLRVGLAAAQGLSQALAIPCLGFTNFAATAGAIGPGQKIAVVIDSQKADVYVQIFNASGAPQAPPSFASEQDVAQMISDDMILTGSATPRLLPHLKAHPLIKDKTSLDLCHYIAHEAVNCKPEDFPCDAFYLKEPAISKPKNRA